MGQPTLRQRLRIHLLDPLHVRHDALLGATCGQGSRAQAERLVDRPGRITPRNQARGFMDLALFECGPVFSGGEPGEQDLHLTAIMVGHTAPRDPFASRRKVDIYDAKADAEAVLAQIGAGAPAQ